MSGRGEREEGGKEPEAEEEEETRLVKALGRSGIKAN